MRPTQLSRKSPQPHSSHLRDGELALYRRSRSVLYPCRCKLAEGSWHRRRERIGLEAQDGKAPRFLTRRGIERPTLRTPALHAPHRHGALCG